ncbi:autophagy protein [Mollisia scopiformis]|uniref:Autophagy protein n=1 Tax=Mollisia scopiformis TaxID=149040 RepID=A0A194XPN3_MOLSC|nr:autophagy protein [Mollisia scopiformis]KUJ22210.1 autophagy protein [Mollisia scopiformis]
MASWRDEYVQALQERDQRERASYQRLDDDLIAAYTNLLDRATALEAEKAANTSSVETTKARESTSTPNPNDGSAQLRKDLAEALRSNGQLQSRVKVAEAELVKLKAKSKTDSRLIDDLSKERGYLSQKLKDRDEESRGKTKLLDDVHDEVISLNLQLNMSEQRNKDLRSENKELIDRWMARKGHEAEEMNRTLQDQLDRR